MPNNVNRSSKVVLSREDGSCLRLPPPSPWHMAGGPNCFYIVVQNLNCLFLLIYFKKMCILATLKFKSQVVYLFGWFFTIWFEKSCTIIPWLFPYMPSIEKTVIILSTGHDCIWWLIAHKTINKIRLNNWHCNVKRDHGTPLSWIQPWIWQIKFSALKVIWNSKKVYEQFSRCCFRPAQPQPQSYPSPSPLSAL